MSLKVWAARVSIVVIVFFLAMWMDSIIFVAGKTMGCCKNQ